jgi:hypothetical protein
MIRSLNEINEEFLSDIISAPPPASDMRTPDPSDEAGDLATFPDAESVFAANNDAGDDDTGNDDTGDNYVSDLEASLEADGLAALFDEAAARIPNGDVDDLIGDPDGAPNGKPAGGRKLSGRTFSIAGIIIGIILIIVAIVMLVEGSSALNGDASGGGEQTQVGDADPDAESGDGITASGVGEGEYDSALDNLENEINSARESQTESGAATPSEASGGTDAAVTDTAVTDAAGTDASEIEIASLYLYMLGLKLMEDADVSNVNTGSDISPARKTHLIERIDAYISEESDGDAISLPTDEEINSDSAFTGLTAPANALVNEINAGRESRKMLPDVIDLRERAYSIYPLRILKKLLAGDYEELGSYYAPAYASEAFDAFIYSIKYRMEYLSDLRLGSDAHSTEMQRVGRTFTRISEIGGLNDASKWNAELIASCFFEISAR